MKRLLFGVFLTLFGSVIFPMDSQDGSKAAAANLFLAVYNGDFCNTQIYADASTIQATTKGGDTALHLAVQGDCNYECIECLLKRSAPVNAQDGCGLTPMHWLMLKKTEQRTIELLLKHGADVSITDKKGISPLHFLSQSRHVATLQLLMKNGAARWINMPNKVGNTPLHVALKYYNSVPPLPKSEIEVNIEESKEKHQEFIRLLLENKACPFIKNQMGESPFDMAKKNPYLKKRIFEPHIEKLNEAKKAKLIRKMAKAKPANSSGTKKKKTKKRTAQKNTQLPKKTKMPVQKHRATNVANSGGQQGQDISDLILQVCVRAIETKGTNVRQ